MRQTLKGTILIEGHAVRHLTYNIIACRKRKRQIFKSEFCLSNKATFCQRHRTQIVYKEVTHVPDNQARFLLIFIETICTKL